MGKAVTFTNLTLGYTRHPAVHHLHGQILEGEMLAIIGPNGGGKSTLLKAIAGRIRPMEGAIKIGISPLAYMPQLSDIQRDFPISAFDFALSGAFNRRGLFGALTPEDTARTHDAFAQTGLTGLEKRALRTLSGGQMQRLIFARLIVQNAALIILDEPFTAIDTQTLEDLLPLLHQWHKEGRTLVTVLHDLALVRAHFPQTLVLAREVVAWGPTQTALSETSLHAAHAYMAQASQPAVPCERQAG